MERCGWCFAWGSAVAIVIGVGAVAAFTAAASAEDVEIDSRMLRVFQPGVGDRIESRDQAITDEKADLGRKLFFDPRTTAGMGASCNSCHQLDNYGVDGQRSVGHAGQPHERATPTIYNVAGHFAHFWDARADSIEEASRTPVSGVEEEQILAVLASIPGYVELFEQAFPEDEQPVNLTNYGVALGAYQRLLTTPSPWDAFLDGEENALTPLQKEGFNEFVAAGCVACHMQSYVGGHGAHKLGSAEPWFTEHDRGRYEQSGNERDRFVFKSTSLRNVAETGPYHHDGSVDDLAESVRLMARHQSGNELTDAQVEAIVAWLESLTGELPHDLITEPELPEDGPDTQTLLER